MRWANIDRVIFAAQQAHIDRAVMRGDRGHRLGDIDGVAGIDDGQVRQAAEDREILGCLVAGAIAGGEAGQRTDDLDRQIFLGDRHGDEVIGATRGKDGVSRGERNEFLARHAGGGRNHHLLGHAHLVEAIREGFGEDMQVGIFGQIGGEADNALVLLRFRH